MYHGCYLIPPGKMTYDVAQANCKIMGAKLAEPINAEVDLAIANMVSHHAGNNKNYWLGINDRNDPIGRTWVYESTGEPVKYFNWAPGEPTSLKYNNTNYFSITE